MAWFKRQEAGIRTDTSQRNDTPDGYWIKCDTCDEISNRRALEEQALVCAHCGAHFRMNSLGYFHLLFNEGAFELYDDHLIPNDPLGFEDRKAYAKRLVQAQEKTRMNDAVRSAIGMIGPYRMSVAAMDFSFIGGSMGSVVGEVLTRAIRRAYEGKIPLLIISQSGGARMMESALSLMQMAKTSANLARLSEAGLPYFSLMTHPTTGGVTASFAMLGDVNLAEPGALIGFAGPRVIRDTTGQDLPEGFQRSEFLLAHGFVDRIVSRLDLRDTLLHFLNLIYEGETA